ncbi:hypothetical protein L195_g056174 [Trifolium pratense]|uniref:Uncharacterized protein n=1 Tax=Trifolium pratense TaxID=57577 RepID=A0A2K3KDM0_TRIPR|nr:hypothetical protein L195_g053987 [Trifolium pratense]PNX68448.1 hypothetical protein L195_g056174 [Trifolium pratense]
MHILKVLACFGLFWSPRRKNWGWYGGGFLPRSMKGWCGGGCDGSELEVLRGCGGEVLK